MRDLDEAYDIMVEYHKGQKRWDGSQYSNHPKDVVKQLMLMGVRDEEILSAGYLHDTLEDTHYNESMMSVKFGDRVTSLVQELTFKQGMDDTYYLAHCQQMSKDASLIKIADIISNLTDKGKKSDHFVKKRMKAIPYLMRNIT